MNLPLVDDSTALASVLADPQRTINLFVERTAAGNTKTPGYLRKRPCLTPFTINCGNGPIRANGVFQLSTDTGRAFAVAGSRVIEFDSSGTILADFGAVIDDGLPVSWATNGTAGGQLGVSSGGSLYCLDLTTSTFAVVGTAPANIKQLEFMDGYVLASIHNTRRFQISALEDLTAWDPIDVAERSEAADNIVAMIRNHREIWFLGQETSEVWYDNGDPLFPFAPIQGVFVENGTVAAFGVCRADNTILYIDRDERGQGIVRKMDGYTPTRVSTYTVETALRESHVGQLDFAQMFAAQFNGHLFVVIYVSDLDFSWVYDVAENKWFQWAHWDSTLCTWYPLVCYCHAFQFNQHLVGDRLTDTIYAWTLEALTDNLTTP